MAKLTGMMDRNKALFSKGYQEYVTPKWLFKQLDDEFHLELDPCTTKDNPLNTTYFFTKEENGLTKNWSDYHANVYVNPPYHSRNIINWIKKADYESSLGPTVVMLLPARTDTRWFHEYLYKRPRVEIRFLRGRLKFDGYEKTQARNTAPFPSMLTIFYPPDSHKAS